MYVSRVVYSLSEDLQLFSAMYSLDMCEPNCKSVLVLREVFYSASLHQFNCYFLQKLTTEHFFEYFWTLNMLKHVPAWPQKSCFCSSEGSLLVCGKRKAGLKLRINLCWMQSVKERNLNYLRASRLAFELIFSKLSFFEPGAIIMELWYFCMWVFSFKKQNKNSFKPFPVFGFSRKFKTVVAFACVSYFAFSTVKWLNCLPEAQTPQN